MFLLCFTANVNIFYAIEFDEAVAGDDMYEYSSSDMITVEK